MNRLTRLTHLARLRSIFALPLLALLGCQDPSAIAPPQAPSSNAVSPAVPPALPPMDTHLPPGFPGGPKEPPKVSPHLPGLFALARGNRGAWNLELHLAEAGSARTWAVTSKEGFPITVALENNTSVARWTVPMSRFATGDPFDLILVTQGLEAPVRIVIPAMEPGQTMVGLQVQVLK